MIITLYNFYLGTNQFRPQKASEKVGPAVMINDFDPAFDNMKPSSLDSGASDSGPHPAASDSGHLGLEDVEAELRSPVRLAAQSLISHFINHLFHFPMETGASSLNSMVCEQDDNPCVNSASIQRSTSGIQSQISQSSDLDLTLEALQSPNVQLFILNGSTLMSLVELPILESVPGCKIANNQVRLILRDISGKFCWESTALFSSEDSTIANEDGAIGKKS